MDPKLSLFKKYSDPPNTDELLKVLSSLTSDEEIITSINNLYPGWIKNTYTSYSDDYPHLTENWNKLALHLGVSPQKILAVEILALDIVLRSNQEVKVKLLSEASEILTRKGYTVRREEEFLGCIFCGKAIPSKGVYDHLLELNKFPI